MKLIEITLYIQFTIETHLSKTSVEQYQNMLDNDAIRPENNYAFNTTYFIIVT